LGWVSTCLHDERFGAYLLVATSLFFRIVDERLAAGVGGIAAAWYWGAISQAV
jgi:hypothetical protein